MSRLSSGSRPAGPDLDALREALTQRAAEWRDTLLATSNLPAARVLLRRLIEPLVLFDDSAVPDFIRGDSKAKLGLLEGFEDKAVLLHDVASQSIPSWNQIAEFLDRMRTLRDSMGSAA